jgi:pimeloyl-ACP methyl ester carboxylesterase
MSTPLEAKPAPTKPASMREAAARTPGWETVILPGVGHTPQLEVPESVTGTLRDWLRTHF